MPPTLSLGSHWPLEPGSLHGIQPAPLPHMPLAPLPPAAASRTPAPPQRLLPRPHVVSGNAREPMLLKEASLNDRLGVGASQPQLPCPLCWMTQRCVCATLARRGPQWDWAPAAHSLYGLPFPLCSHGPSPLLAHPGIASQPCRSSPETTTRMQGYKLRQCHGQVGDYHRTQDESLTFHRTPTCSGPGPMLRAGDSARTPQL